jgi:hypothetical protein
VVSSSAKTVAEYISELPEDRKSDIRKLRALCRKHLPSGLEEAMNWGMITYQVPLKRFPDTYNGQPLAFAAIASQKHYISLYLMSIYAFDGSRKKFERDWKASGKKLNVGKACIRFKAVADIPLDVITKAIGAVTVEQYLAAYGAARGSLRGKKK